MKTLAIFWWSRELPINKKAELNAELEIFFTLIKWRVDRVIYGWGKDWVMLDIYNKSIEHWVEIIWYSLEKYKKPDDYWENIYFSNDDERLQQFYDNSESAVTFPWSIWTIREVLQYNEFIKRYNKDKLIYISPLFHAFYELIRLLDVDNMIALEDQKQIIKVDNFEIIRI